MFFKCCNWICIVLWLSSEGLIDRYCLEHTFNNNLLEVKKKWDASFNWPCTATKSMMKMIKLNWRINNTIHIMLKERLKKVYILLKKEGEQRTYSLFSNIFIVFKNYARQSCMNINIKSRINYQLNLFIYIINGTYTFWPASFSNLLDYCMNCVQVCLNTRLCVLLIKLIIKLEIRNTLKEYRK